MPTIGSSRGTILLVTGDIIVFLFSLILTLALRYWEIPTRSILSVHALSFSILTILFLLVYFSAGLYEKESILLRGRRLGQLLRVQAVNAAIGVMFFYFAPVAIAPKANLLIYFAVSTGLIVLWRMVIYPVVSISRRQTAILVGKGDDLEDLYLEVTKHHRYAIAFREHIAPGVSPKETEQSIGDAVSRTGASFVAVDLRDPAIEAITPFLYSLIFKGVQIIDASRLYEAVFDRVPLSLVGERWFIENSSTALGNRRLYDIIKRAIDIAIAGVIGAVSLIMYPFVLLAIKLDDKGPIFISQTRIGRKGRLIRIYKFRSMSGNDGGNYGSSGGTSLKVTRVGRWIRASRIDELPQLWNVLRGDLSLVGPRPEIPTLASIYDKEIPYYNARHLVKPGLSGWAQIYHQTHPHHAVATEDTRDKLAYDLYYIKNRSLALDIKIALRTIQIVTKRVGK